MKISFRKKSLIGFLLLLVQAAVAFGQQKPDALAAYRAGRDLENAGRMADAEIKYSEAIQICMDEINSQASTMDTYAVLTWTLQRQKKYNEVISRGQEALRIIADYRVIETMGEAYFYLNNFPAALASMQRYANQLPNGDRAPTAYFFIGEIYRYQKKYNYADIAYTTALQLAPGMSLWWYRLGTVREAVGDNRYAQDAYERALKIDPEYTQARDGLARVKRDRA
ncbi:hypothetical protein AGMMS50212_09680 [Spirochaetia bacterium]|nr:hypothetical protein AGMMS50212_09680 [Spirochaetia bacterium]